MKEQNNQKPLIEDTDNENIIFQPKEVKGRKIFESLQFRDFRWLWIGSFASYMSMNMQMIARGWLVLRLADDSPLALSLISMAFALPMTFMSLIGGALADRLPRRKTIMLCQIGNAIWTFILATLDTTGLIKFWHLFLIGVINGTLMAINIPSRQAIISDIVPMDKLMNAISLNSSGMNLTRILGPAVAGILIIYIDTSGVFYLISVSYLLSGLSMTMIETGRSPAVPRNKGFINDIREGFSYVASDYILFGLIIMLFIPTLFGFCSVTLLPAWGREALSVSSDDLGIMMMIMGVGSLVGSLILASMRDFHKRGILLLVLGILWGVGLALLSQSKSFNLAIPFLLIIGFMSSVFMSLNMTLIQTYAKHEMRGRVMSISIMTFGAMPLSSVPFGALAEKIGTPNALGLSGLLLIISTIVFGIAYPRFREIK